MSPSHLATISFQLFLVLMFLAGCSPRIPEISGTAYYIDCAKGDDSNEGTSPSRAWKSLDLVNQTVFKPGDGIFIKRGTTCQGVLTPQGSGVEDHPIIMGAYGRGELPIIDAGDHPEAIKLIGQEYWEIQDIETTGGTKFGILVSGKGGVKELYHIRLTNLVVHDVWGEPFSDKVPGLVVILSNGSIFKDVIIDGITAYNTDQWAGIEINGSASWPPDWDNPAFAQDVIVRNATVYNVYGDGIVLWGVRNGLIEHNVAYETGQQPPPQTVGTPSSIWTWSCYDCVVQFNESYNSASPEVDAGCYDIDWGTRNNTFQYNYGHDCDGYCISVFGAGGRTTENAIARYNICANNGRRSNLAARQGDIFLSTWDNGKLDGVLIHNNTFFWNPERNYPALVNKAVFSGEQVNIFANNIIVSTVPWLVDGGVDLDLNHNMYWLTGEGQPFFNFDNAYYTGFEEYQNLSGHGTSSIFTNPSLKDFTYHQVGFPEDAFTLQDNSPAIDAGLDLERMGEHDFFGSPIPYGGAYDIGAHEWTPGKRGSTIPSGLFTYLWDLFPLVREARNPLLVGLINVQGDPASRSQVVYLRSMARQYTERGLQVALIDTNGLPESERINLSYSWHLGDIPLLSLPVDLKVPVTVLFSDGQVQRQWHGLVLPAALDTALHQIIN